MNDRVLQCLGHAFDMTLKRSLSQSEIARLSSQFLNQMCDPDGKDEMAIKQLEDQGDKLRATVAVAQKKRHPNSDDGFHFSAWPAADLVHRLALQFISPIAPGERPQADWFAFAIRCKRSIREHDFEVEMTRAVEPSSARLDFAIKDSAFSGEIRYKQTSLWVLPSGLERPEPGFAHQDRFAIERAHIDGPSSQFEVRFQSDCPTSSGAALGPGLAIAIASQVVIVHAYALCGVVDKTSGIVLKSFGLTSQESIASPDSINVDVQLRSIEPAYQQAEYVVIDAVCVFAGGKARAEMRYYFEPF